MRDNSSTNLHALRAIYSHRASLSFKIQIQNGGKFCCYCVYVEVTMAENTTYLSNYLKGAWFIALTHIVVGMLLFVMAIMDRLYGRDPGIERFYLGISSGVWVSW